MTCLLTPAEIDAVREAADPGYLEDAAAEELYAATRRTDMEEILAMSAIPQSEIVGGPALVGGGGGWSNNWITYGGTTGTYFLPQVTTSSTSNTITVSYGGGGGGTGGYATGSTTNDWVYLGTSDEWSTYVPPGVYRDELVDQPQTEETATREWLWAERQYYNSWLAAAAQHKDAERQRKQQLAEDRAEALLLSLLPEPERQRYRLQSYFEVIGSHGGHYRIKRGVAGNIDWLHPDGPASVGWCGFWAWRWR